jgi:hypothetical protein
MKKPGNLSQHLSKALKTCKAGEWTDGFNVLLFEDLPRRLSSCNRVLEAQVKPHAIVAVMLPLSAEGMLMNAYLTVKSKCVVNISPSLDNEERMCVMRSNSINLLITTRDLQFTGYAPNAAEVIYIEDVTKAMEQKKCLQQVCGVTGAWARDLRNWFRPMSTPSDVVALICEKNKETGVTSTPLRSSEVFHMINVMGEPIRKSGNKKMLFGKEVSDVNGYMMGFMLPLFYDLKVKLVR